MNGWLSRVVQGVLFSQSLNFQMNQLWLVSFFIFTHLSRSKVKQLLVTKLYISPTLPDLVSRPRLIERLNAGLHLKLTLISGGSYAWSSREKNFPEET